MKIYFLLLISICLVSCSLTAKEPQGLVDGTVTTKNSEGLDYVDPTKTIFPMDNYSQSVDKWISPKSEKINIPVMDGVTQTRNFANLKSHYFGMNKEDHSPWNPYYISSILSGSDSVIIKHDKIIKEFLSQDSISYGENFRVNSSVWKETVRNNADINIDGIYHPSGRGITLRETLVRMLPTDDPAYDDPREAGQGYPFDNLQDSSVRPGTPIYVFAASQDKNWKYIASPTVTGWVKSDDVAVVGPKFIAEWISLAEKNLGAVIKEPVSVHKGEQFYFTARPGTILPFSSEKSGGYQVAIPVRKGDSHVEINWVTLKKDQFTAMPWKMTPANIATLMKSMSGRSYGWGNYHFYNDCSAEIRSLMMPFGLFLPRNSAQQIQEIRVVDLSKELLNKRIKYLKDHGKPFTTLIYIKGHIMLYIGNATVNGEEVPMTYQNIWGLRPKDSSSRSIIGGSVFFPLLPFYPERPNLESLAGKEVFKLGFIE
ncbi:SH3 domain-containing protein [Yersinia vastinensis]|uniref:SH3 domain-containing protein n=1 Tax=Yersinia vastinensis TaxID=2890318 RepID=UPI0005E900FD|nr:SH3 domain-containing protein [Yersinia vastinensis]OVZ97005.1 cell wall hydrolase [Yersinia frederiksenii]CNI40941.1 putative cell wall-associated hydrolase [Yersinia frederiksenii]